jgi:serine/threonine-protein kinase
MTRHALPETVDASRRSRSVDSADSARFSLATGEEPLARVRTDLPDADASDRYEPGPTLGEGGMGVVRLERDRVIGRHVAVKTLHADLRDPTTERRFLREGRAQAQLEHPAIVPVYDLGRDAHGPFFTMKRVRGHTLARILEGLVAETPEYVSRFGRRRLLTAFLSVCRAVHYAHARRVLHRDLKPSNVMLGDFGEVYVLDWGLARIMDEAPLEPRRIDPTPLAPVMSNPAIDVSFATVDDGNVAGTPGYMAPEQVTSGTLDARTDVYALGIVLYEILTLRRYRENTSLAAAAIDIDDGRIARPSTIDDSVAPELDEVCARATALDPEARFASAGAMAEALERFLDGEQDSAMRAAAASRHTAHANELLASTERDGRDARRVHAMQELLRAVTLDPGARDARTRLVELLSNAGEIPAGARGDIKDARLAHRAEGTTAAILGMIAWLLPVPVVFAVAPVLSWPVMGTAIAACVLVALVSHFARVTGRMGIASSIAIATFMGVIVMAISGVLGPFMLTPTLAVASCMMFSMYVSRAERHIGTAIFVVASLLPSALELAGIVPPSMLVEDGHVVVFARALTLPPIVTPAALAWASVTFILFSSLLIGRMRDRMERAEDRLLVSAWYLRQLFGAEASISSTPSARAAE